MKDNHRSFFIFFVLILIGIVFITYSCESIEPEVLSKDYLQVYPDKPIQDSLYVSPLTFD